MKIYSREETESNNDDEDGRSESGPWLGSELLTRLSLESELELELSTEVSDMTVRFLSLEDLIIVVRNRAEYLVLLLFFSGRIVE